MALDELNQIKNRSVKNGPRESILLDRCVDELEQIIVRKDRMIALYTERAKNFASQHTDCDNRISNEYLTITEELQRLI